MYFKKYQLAILGMWIYWLAIFLFWMDNYFFLWRWLVLGLGGLFLMTSFYLLGAGRYKEHGHPLLEDNLILDKQQKIKRKTWQTQRRLYQFIVPLYDDGYTWDEIKAKVETELGNGYPSSVDTLQLVYKKGQQGFYENFGKTS